MPRQWKYNPINRHTCCAPPLGRSTTTLPSSTSMRPLRTCGFSRPCASAPLFFFHLLCVLSLFHFLLLLPHHLLLHLPFICPIISSPLFYKLRWGTLQEITWVLTHSLFTTPHRRTELPLNKINPKIFHYIPPFCPIKWLFYLRFNST